MIKSELAAVLVLQGNKTFLLFNGRIRYCTLCGKKLNKKIRSQEFLYGALSGELKDIKIGVGWACPLDHWWNKHSHYATIFIGGEERGSYD